MRWGQLACIDRTTKQLSVGNIVAVKQVIVIGRADWLAVQWRVEVKPIQGLLHRCPKV